MKILQFSCYYYPHIGGIEQVARDVSDALCREHEVRVICFNHEKGKSCESEVDGVKVVRAKCNAKVASQQLSLSFKKLLRKQFKTFKPDVLIFHYPNPFAAHYVLKALKKHPECKLVLYWHLDITKQKLLGKLFNGQTARLLKRASKIIATSPDYIKGSKFLPEFKDKCSVVSCCVNGKILEKDEIAEEKSSEIKRQNQGKIILFAVGRHVPYKGMEYLVRASKLLDDTFAVYIGGKGELTDSLIKLAEDDKKVTFLGRLDETTLKAYLKACDIFCFPSITKNEAFGIALAEAMSYGKPAVTFTIEGSGVNYVSINGVTGIEVENRNVEKYAQAIKLLAADGGLKERFGTAAKMRVKQLFTQEIFKNNINQVIGEL